MDQVTELTELSVSPSGASGFALLRQRTTLSSNRHGRWSSYPSPDSRDERTLKTRFPSKLNVSSWPRLCENYEAQFAKATLRLLVWVFLLGNPKEATLARVLSGDSGPFSSATVFSHSLGRLQPTPNGFCGSALEVTDASVFPESLEPIRRQLGVAHRVLDVLVPE